MVIAPGMAMVAACNVGSGEARGTLEMAMGPAESAVVARAAAGSAERGESPGTLRMAMGSGIGRRDDGRRRASLEGARITGGMMEKNVHHVSRRMWGKWSEQARSVFNSVYDFAMKNKWAMLHPKQRAPKPEFWATTCWNMAWIAADAVDGIVPSNIVEGTKAVSE